MTFSRCESSFGNNLGHEAAAATITAVTITTRMRARTLATLRELPDVLGREAPGPLERREPRVRGAGVGRRTELDQVLDLEAVRAEQADPLAVGQLEVH